MTYEPSEDREKYEDHQMTPLKGGRYKTILHGPLDTDVGDLYCDLEPYMEGARPALISHSGWMPTDEQIEQLRAGAHVRLAVWQHPIPPLAVGVEPPVCACHGRSMAWHPAKAGYYCNVVPDSYREVRESFTPEPGHDDDEE